MNSPRSIMKKTTLTTKSFSTQIKLPSKPLSLKCLRLQTPPNQCLEQSLMLLSREIARSHQISQPFSCPRKIQYNCSFSQGKRYLKRLRITRFLEKGSTWSYLKTRVLSRQAVEIKQISKVTRLTCKALKTKRTIKIKVRMHLGPSMMDQWALTRAVSKKKCLFPTTTLQAWNLHKITTLRRVLLLCWPMQTKTSKNFEPV